MGRLKRGTTLAYFHSSDTTAEEIERFLMAFSGVEMLGDGLAFRPLPFDVLSNLS